MGIKEMMAGAQAAYQTAGIIDRREQQAMMNELYQAQIGQIESNVASKELAAKNLKTFQTNVGALDQSDPDYLKKLAQNLTAYDPGAGATLMAKLGDQKYKETPAERKDREISTHLAKKKGERKITEGDREAEYKEKRKLAYYKHTLNIERDEAKAIKEAELRLANLKRKMDLQRTEKLDEEARGVQRNIEKEARLLQDKLTVYKEIQKMKPETMNLNKMAILSKGYSLKEFNALPKKERTEIAAVALKELKFNILQALLNPSGIAGGEAATPNDKLSKILNKAD